MNRLVVSRLMLATASVVLLLCVAGGMGVLWAFNENRAGLDEQQKMLESEFTEFTHKHQRVMGQLDALNSGNAVAPLESYQPEQRLSLLRTLAQRHGLLEEFSARVVEEKIEVLSERGDTRALKVAIEFELKNVGAAQIPEVIQGLGLALGIQSFLQSCSFSANQQGQFKTGYLAQCRVVSLARSELVP